MTEVTTQPLPRCLRDASIDPDADFADGAHSYLADPAARRYPFAFMNRMRDACPVQRGSSGTWLVTGYDEVKAVESDARFSRQLATDRTLDRYFDDGVGKDTFRLAFTTVDGPVHRRRRSLVRGQFSAAAIRRWRPRLVEMAEELVGGLEHEERVEFRGRVAYPFSERVICTVLGVPFDEFEQLEAWSDATTNRPPLGEGASVAYATDALNSFMDYLFELVERRERQPQDDLITGLVELEKGPDGLSRGETVACIRELITGGHETTAGLATNAMLMLLGNPEQYALLGRGPEVVDSAVEEILRFFTSAQLGLIRVAAEDIELGGTTIPEGDLVYASLAASGRDPAVFERPDEFDVTRSHNPHLAFGHGVHFCLGAPLTRIEMQVLLEVLARRVPDWRLLDDDPAWRAHALMNTPRELWVGRS